jgi:ferrous iron transport protein A
MKTASPDIRFSELQPGMRAQVQGYTTTGDGVDRFADLGLVPGAEFEVVRQAPFGGPLEICIAGSSLCLRRCDGDCVLLKALNAQKK